MRTIYHRNREKDPEKYRKKQREKRIKEKLENPEKYREQKRKKYLRYKSKNPEKYRELSKLRQARYRLRHPERVMLQHKKYRSNPINKQKEHEYYQKNKQRHKATSWKTKLRIRYGITVEEFETMKINQDGKCLICKRVRFLNIDHCHKTGKVRGLLCITCNAALGGMNDNIEILERAIIYLKKNAT